VKLFRKPNSKFYWYDFTVRGRRYRLWRPAGRAELEAIVLAPWATRRRQDLLDLLDQLTPKIQVYGSETAVRVLTNLMRIESAL
jgi:hypothetical protein